METPLPSKPSLDLDPRASETLKWSAIGNVLGNLVEAILVYIGAQIFVSELANDLSGFDEYGPLSNIPFGLFVRNAVWAAVFGAVIGFLISKFYGQLQKWNRQFLQGRLKNFFALMFYPSLVISLIGFLGFNAYPFYFGVMAFVVGLAGIFLRSYLYAYIMTRKVGTLYPPPF
ncbi:MAG: hypothetical protein AAB588_05595 [Patescibacteria group bacterium]